MEKKLFVKKLELDKEVVFKINESSNMDGAGNFANGQNLNDSGLTFFCTTWLITKTCNTIYVCTSTYNCA
jgi:hypothetical protein